MIHQPLPRDDNLVSANRQKDQVARFYLKRRLPPNWTIPKLGNLIRELVTSCLQANKVRRPTFKQHSNDIYNPKLNS